MEISERCIKNGQKGKNRRRIISTDIGSYKQRQENWECADMGQENAGVTGREDIIKNTGITKG
jgi:hypothetical protein